MIHINSRVRMSIAKSENYILNSMLKKATKNLKITGEKNRQNNDQIGKRR